MNGNLLGLIRLIEISRKKAEYSGLDILVSYC